MVRDAAGAQGGCVARHRGGHQPGRNPVQHGEHDEHRGEQEFVRGRIKDPPERRLPTEAFGKKAVSGVRSRRDEEKAEGFDQVAVQQTERDRYHEQNPERGDDVREVPEPRGRGCQ